MSTPFNTNTIFTPVILNKTAVTWAKVVEWVVKCNSNHEPNHTSSFVDKHDASILRFVTVATIDAWYESQGYVNSVNSEL